LGKFIYESNVRMDVDDRVLMHLQLVIGTKLRRNEPFYFTWASDVSVGGGRTSVWVHSGANIVFSYYGKRQPSVNRTWLESLMRTANTPSGLQIVPEPADVGETEPLG